MKHRETGVYQFKITLQDVKPAVWRRIQTPSGYSFWDLHVAIQDAMGWRDSHLHEFRIPEPKTGDIVTIGLPDDGEFGDEKEVAHCRDCSVADYFSPQNPAGRYVYDFGDDWKHEILFEESVPAAKSVKSPLCLDGKGACPPEDCGGPHGYAEFLRAIKKPGSPRGSELLEWVGGSFDPNVFERSAVTFDDPIARWAWSTNDSILLANELQEMKSAGRQPDRQGRVAFRIPLTQHTMILKHAAGLDAALLEQLGKACAKNDEMILKLDLDELKLLGAFLASHANNGRRGLDRRIFAALREHFAAMESLLRGV
jgi:hypothetical protein